MSTIPRDRRSRVYSVLDLAESCNISVKEAHNFVSDPNRPLDINQFTKLQQVIMNRSALFSNSFNPYYASAKKSKKKQHTRNRSNCAIVSDYNVNTNHINEDVYIASDRATVDTTDIHQQKMEILVDDFSKICSKVQRINNVPKSQKRAQNIKKPLKILLNDTPLNRKQRKHPISAAKTDYKQMNSRNGNKRAVEYKSVNGIWRPQPITVREWNLDIKYDGFKACIVINVTEGISKRNWRKVLTKYDCRNGEVQKQYFRLGKLMSNGTITYSNPHRGSENVQVCVSTNNEIYNLLLTPI